MAEGLYGCTHTTKLMKETGTETPVVPLLDLIAVLFYSVSLLYWNLGVVSQLLFGLSLATFPICMFIFFIKPLSESPSFLRLILIKMVDPQLIEINRGVSIHIICTYLKLL
jgi:hypothetical protein